MRFSRFIEGHSVIDLLVANLRYDLGLYVPQGATRVCLDHLMHYRVFGLLPRQSVLHAFV